ncbi:GNAT family N-acetyltransferase [Maribacter algarum]|uniref:GNAT family N-acetyltransferase n=1 Tax=Maribacter algarum (ex Zhang et al. 2020) TaxID=2578118 RepID=A0A5S3PWA2_9FLAO|nr:GNAT family N-acetyltransferase [Maribacter algarum]TMM59279.1 GNAT family N-acetyltransferase [Maribacter algarum]
MEVTFSRVSCEGELLQILALQKKNALDVVSSIEKQNEGFVTVSHSFGVLKQMNDACAHVIAKDANKVVGYALVMLKEFRDEISVLSAMFETAEELLGDKHFLAMGQICISKAYRKRGIFRGMYTFYKEELQDEFDCLLTEVATENKRSLEAHKSIGFKVLKTQVTDGISWELISWDWK